MADREVWIMITRRLLLAGGATGLILALAGTWRPRTSIADETFEVTPTEAQWRKLLTADPYGGLGGAGTGRPFPRPRLHEERAGRFACAGCGLDLFSSTTKFDSGTGWPSFWAPLDNAVGTTNDPSYGMVRTA